MRAGRLCVAIVVLALVGTLVGPAAAQHVGGAVEGVADVDPAEGAGPPFGPRAEGERGRQDHAGQPGPPEHAGRPDGAGPPEHARGGGRPDHVGGPGPPGSAED